MIVYYSCEYFFGSLPIQPPKNILQIMSKDIDTKYTSLLLKCPGITSHYKNIYAIYPTYDYELNYDGSNISSNLYNQYFFDKFVVIRNLEGGFVSYMDPPISFFTEEDSLEIETMPPFANLEDNSFNYVIGRYDIGKHLRKLSIDISFNKKTTHLFKRDNPLYYVKFNTNEKIQFKRFVYTEELQKLVDGILSLRSFTKNNNTLNFFYNIIEKYNYKKKYLNIIKQNLID